jgi:ABC-type glycerol-3-phosphate transport system substrate-binding protein
VKNFARVICALLAAALLGACGGGSSSGGAMATAPATQDTTLTMDGSAWDAGDWAG